jgi:hypothetical protein
MLRASSRDEGRPLTFCTQDWIAFASVSISDLTERNRAAQELFAPLAATYDRYAQPVQPRPRSSLALVSRLAFEARPEDTILDVATATAAVALELARRYRLPRRRGRPERGDARGRPCARPGRRP